MMWLWLIIIHVIELAVVGAVLLIRRNSALEKAVLQQREFIDAISIIVTNSDEKLRELDINGVFEVDDEVEKLLGFVPKKVGAESQRLSVKQSGGK